MGYKRIVVVGKERAVNHICSILHENELLDGIEIEKLLYSGGI